MKEIVKLMGVIFCWISVGLTAPTDFSLEDLQSLKDVPPSRLVYNDETPNEQNVLDCINGALVPGYGANQSLLYLQLFFRVPSPPSILDLTQNANGYYQFPSLQSFVSRMNYPGHQGFVYPSLEPIDLTSSFLRADMQAWNSYTPSQFVSLASTSYVSASAENFLNALNSSWARYQQQRNLNVFTTLYLVLCNPSYANYNGESYSFPSFTVLTQAISTSSYGIAHDAQRSYDPFVI